MSRRSIHVVSFLCFAACLFGAGVAGIGADKESQDLTADLLKPFWRSTTVQDETLFFAERKAGQPGSATLLFPPQEILSVKSATGETVYEKGRDYVLDGEGVLRVTPGSRIPVTTQAELYQPKEAAGRAHWGVRRGDPNTVLAQWSFDIHLRQVAVTYTYAKGLWRGPVPEYAGANLPRTTEKLRGRKPILMWVIGDSISVGHAASSMRRDRKPPAKPPYFNLVAMGIEKACGTQVQIRNFSGNGRIAGWGTAQIERLSKRDGELGKPDLAIIAFGMNDWCRGITAEKFAANVKMDMDKVRELSRDAEFILISPMLPWPEWSAPDTKMFDAYPAALSGLCGQGVVLANMTSLWMELLKRKDFHDMGDALNHPNDFGHKLYAQVILGLLVKDPQ